MSKRQQEPSQEIILYRDDADEAAGLLIPFHQQAHRNPARTYLKNLAASSQIAMGSILNTIAGLFGQDIDTMPWHLLRYEHTNAIRQYYLSKKRSPTTVNKAVAALRGTLREAWRLELIEHGAYTRACDIDPVRIERNPNQATGRHLSPGEIAAFLAACGGDSIIDARDAALFSIGVGCGLRRNEIAQLDVKDWDGQRLHVLHGKNNKRRTVNATYGTVNAIENWLDARGRHPGPLFVRMRRGDVLTDQRMTPYGIRLVFARRAKQATIKAFTPHDLRRTFAGNLLDAGADIALVQKLMGHASPITTSSYDRRGDETQQRTVNKLHIPCERRIRR